MTEAGGITSPDETQTIEPLRVTDVLDLKPGTMYRFHRLAQKDNPASWEEVEAQDFYVTNPIDTESYRYKNEAKIDVRYPNPNKYKYKEAGSDTYASLHIGELGPAITSRFRDKLNLDLLRLNRMNWVEELPPVEPQTSDQ